MTKEFYLATRDINNKYLIYESESYKFREIDILSLIKILIKDARNKSLGKKILDIYRDSTLHNKIETDKKLKEIGILNGKKDPTKTKRIKTR